jgi:glycosidase
MSKGLTSKQTLNLLVSAVIAVLVFSCAVVMNPVSEVTVIETIPDGYGVMTVEIPEIRGWSVSQYTVTATRSGENPVIVTTPDSTVSMTLKLGQWSINVTGADADGTIIYQGIATANVTESGTSVTVGLLKRAGNLKLTVNQYPSYNIGDGNPGTIEKILVSVSKDTFPTINREVNNFSSSLFFTGLAQGDWNVSVEAQARDVDPATYAPLGSYTTYVSGSFVHTITASQLLTVTDVLDTQEVVTPVSFSHASGSYSAAIDLLLDCETANRTIYYTLDGTTPTTLSTVYSGALPVTSGTVTVKAMATAFGVTTPSIVGTRTYTIDAGVTSTPQMSPAGGTYSVGQSVTVTSPDGGTIYYTTDGSTPTTASAVYSSQIPVLGDGTTMTIKAVALAPAKTISSVASATYIIDYPQVVDPVISPASGTYTTDQLFTIECGTPSATIYYTIDGSVPTTASPVYSTPFTLAEGSVTVRAMATAASYSDSSVVSESYTISSDAISSIQLLEAEVIILGEDYTVKDVYAGANWFGFQVDTAGNYDMDWTVGFSGVITLYENDTVTEVPLSGSGDARTASLSVGTYFVKVNATYDVAGYQVRVQYAGALPTTTTTTVVGTTTTSTTTTTIAPTDLTVYFKDRGYTPSCYAWKEGPVALLGDWPGTAMTDDGDGWWVITISGETSASLIFSNNGSGQTPDLSRDKTGWYFTDNQWYDENPEGPQVPIVTVSPVPGTYVSGQSVTLSSTNGANDTIYYTTNGTDPDINSPIYTVPVNVSSSMTLKAIARNELSEWGVVHSFVYVIDADADLEAPSITNTVATGHHDNSISASFTITDNKSAATTAYYTTDGTTATTSSPVYVSGNASSGLTGPSISVSETTQFSFLVVDGVGLEDSEQFYYHIGSVNITRFDPRQETIYFLLTSRWFDGDSANSIGDEWCSYTEERVTPGSPNYVEDNGFTGPEDVTWRGDFKGLVEKMDYIKALGFTAIWINPVVQNRGPLAYHGYHGWDFMKEDARLVSPGYDFQRVVDEAHARDMKICLDIVLNHSGRMGIKDFAEIKYNSDPNLYVVPDEWGGWTYDESRHNSGAGQIFPNGWEYDGLTSPGTVDGVALNPWERFADIRPFTSADTAYYPNLLTDTVNGLMKYQWPCTESYCLTIDGKVLGAANSLDYNGYKNSARRMRGHNTGFPTGSASFDNFPDAHFDSLHEDTPDLNIENPEVQNYLLAAYYRYIDMGVDMFRVDTVMHMHKQTLNEMYWPQLLAHADSVKDTRGGNEFYIFGEVANFVGNPTDKASQLREQNYTWADGYDDVSSSNHWLDGNDYRTPDYSNKAPNAFRAWTRWGNQHGCAQRVCQWSWRRLWRSSWQQSHVQ